MPAAEVVLTVAEGKRLIARAVAQHPLVKQALQSGRVVICRGSTTAYVAEELLGRKIRKDHFILGRTLPASFQKPEGLFDGSITEILLERGQPVQVESLAQALENIQAGDVIIKGANALDWQNRLAAHLIGHPDGGTLGLILGKVHGRGAHLIIPVGLEKQLPMPILDVARQIADTHSDTSLPRFWVTTGIIITEIEAIEILSGARAIPVGSGGICGAEGACRLRILGTTDQVDRALQHVQAIQGEPDYLSSCLTTE